MNKWIYFNFPTIYQHLAFTRMRILIFFGKKKKAANIISEHFEWYTPTVRYTKNKEKIFYMYQTLINYGYMYAPHLSYVGDDAYEEIADPIDDHSCKVLRVFTYKNGTPSSFMLDVHYGTLIIHSREGQSLESFLEEHDKVYSIKQLQKVDKISV